MAAVLRQVLEAVSCRRALGRGTGFLHAGETAGFCTGCPPEVVLIEHQESRLVKWTATAECVRIARPYPAGYLP